MLAIWLVDAAPTPPTTTTTRAEQTLSYRSSANQSNAKNKVNNNNNNNSSSSSSSSAEQFSQLDLGHILGQGAALYLDADAKSNMSLNTELNPATLNLRKRHKKRNSNWYDYYNFNENSTALEWSNPCGGFYVPSPEQQLQRRKNQKQIYNLLKKAAGNEYRTLNSSQEDIDISDIKIWFLHDYNYKFLPKLKINSSIALKRWYRNMQTYVASFAYLRRVQLSWDRRHPKPESRTALELKHLLLSSRSMLCELETAVNHTYALPTTMDNKNGQRLHWAMKRRHLHQITRTQMNKRLKLRTKRRERECARARARARSLALARNGSATGDVSTASGEFDSDAMHEADAIDLQFVKFYYYEFLRSMWKLLRQHAKRQEHLRQQQRRQQQHRTRDQQLIVNNQRKEFNEIEKPAGGMRWSSHSSSSSSGSNKNNGQMKRTHRKRSMRLHRDTRRHRLRQRQRRQSSQRQRAAAHN